MNIIVALLCLSLNATILDKKLNHTSSEDTHDIGLLKCKKCAKAAEERQRSTMTV